jgi:hypothetical protein
MLTKKQFLDQVKHETKVIKHLATQVPAGQLEYRPTPPQRSTIELMRYLTIGPFSSVRYALEGNWEWWDQLEAQSKQVTPETFAKAMDKQVRDIEKALKPHTDVKLAKKVCKDWGGKKMPLDQFLVNGVLKLLVAYRMQLFLYAKASGASHLGTSDCWHGKAAKPKQASAT